MEGNTNDLLDRFYINLNPGPGSIIPVTDGWELSSNPSQPRAWFDRDGLYYREGSLLSNARYAADELGIPCLGVLWEPRRVSTTNPWTTLEAEFLRQSAQLDGRYLTLTDVCYPSHVAQVVECREVSQLQYSGNLFDDSLLPLLGLDYKSGWTRKGANPVWAAPALTVCGPWQYLPPKIRRVLGPRFPDKSRASVVSTITRPWYRLRAAPPEPECCAPTGTTFRQWREPRSFSLDRDFTFERSSFQCTGNFGAGTESVFFTLLWERILSWTALSSASWIVLGENLADIQRPNRVSYRDYCDIVARLRCTCALYFWGLPPPELTTWVTFDKVVWWEPTYPLFSGPYPGLEDSDGGPSCTRPRNILRSRPLTQGNRTSADELLRRRLVDTARAYYTEGRISGWDKGPLFIGVLTGAVPPPPPFSALFTGRGYSLNCAYPLDCEEALRDLAEAKRLGHWDPIFGLFHGPWHPFLPTLPPHDRLP